MITTIEQEKLVAHAAALGERLLTGLNHALRDCKLVTAIRGKGLIIGVELDRPCAALIHTARARGLLINVTAERVIRLLPPLTLSDAEADLIIDGVAAVVRDFANSETAGTA